jgi:hypothetical protein
MSTGRIGGLLFSGGLVLLVVAGAILIAHGAVGIDRDLQPLIAASLGLVGVGAFVLRLDGPPPLRGRLVKLGLTSLAIGSVILAVAVLEWGSLRGIELDFLLVSMVGGGGAVVLGALAVALALARMRGRWEWPGLMLLAGMTLVLLGTWGATAGPLGAMAQTVTAAGGIVIILGALGMGLLATVASEPS